MGFFLPNLTVPTLTFTKKFSVRKLNCLGAAGDFNDFLISQVTLAGTQRPYNLLGFAALYKTRSKSSQKSV